MFPQSWPLARRPERGAVRSSRELGHWPSCAPLGTWNTSSTCDTWKHDNDDHARGEQGESVALVRNGPLHLSIIVIIILFYCQAPSLESGWESLRVCMYVGMFVFWAIDPGIIFQCTATPTHSRRKTFHFVLHWNREKDRKKHTHTNTHTHKHSPHEHRGKDKLGKAAFKRNHRALREPEMQWKNNTPSPATAACYSFEKKGRTRFSHPIFHCFILYCSCSLFSPAFVVAPF